MCLAGDSGDWRDRGSAVTMVRRLLANLRLTFGERVLGNIYWIDPWSEVENVNIEAAVGPLIHGGMLAERNFGCWSYQDRVRVSPFVR